MANAEVSEQARVRSVLEDPSSQAIARTYALAFLNAAGADAAAAVEELTSFVVDVLEKNAEFRALLCGGMLNHDERLQLIDKVVKPRATEMFANFLVVLSRHDRTELIEQICAAATLEYEVRSGRQRVQVITAAPLASGSLEQIHARLKSVFGFEPILEPQIDNKLIGGLVIRVGNSVYDGSLRNRLGQMAKRMQQRSLHEIQSGRDRFSHPEGD